MCFKVFDAPAHNGTYEKRVEYLKSVIKEEKKTTYAVAVGIQKCKGTQHLQQTLAEVLKLSYISSQTNYLSIGREGWRRRFNATKTRICIWSRYENYLFLQHG